MAIDFEASSTDRIIYAVNSGFSTGSNPFSFGCWFNTDSTASTLSPIGLGSSINTASYMCIRVGTTCAAQYSTSVGGGSLASPNVGTVSADTWHHGGGIVESDGVRAVLDGTIGSKSANTINFDNWNRPAIGCAGRQSSQFNDFNGSVAEAAWWLAELVQAEWDALAAGVSPALIRPDALVAYIPLFNTSDYTPQFGDVSVSSFGDPVTDVHPNIIYPYGGGVETFPPPLLGPPFSNARMWTFAE